MEAQNSQSGICMLEVEVDFHGESEGLKTELSWSSSLNQKNGILVSI